MRARAYCAAQLTDGRDLADAFQSFFSAPELVIHEREFQAKGGWFGMDAMAASNAWRELMFVGASGDHLAQFRHIANQNICALHQLRSECRIHNIARGQAACERFVGLGIGHAAAHHDAAAQGHIADQRRRAKRRGYRDFEC